MLTARTNTIAEAVTLVRTKVTSALAALNEGGDTEDARQQMTRYFSARQAERMVDEIFADAITFTPPGIVALLQNQMRDELRQAIYDQAVR